MVERAGFLLGNMLSGSSVIVSARSSCILLVPVLRRVSLVWVWVPLLQLNLPCHYYSRAACLPACLPAALSLDSRCKAASSVSSQGWLKCGRLLEEQCHDSGRGDVCFMQYIKAYINITASKCKYYACNRRNSDLMLLSHLENSSFKQIETWKYHSL